MYYLTEAVLAMNESFNGKFTNYGVTKGEMPKDEYMRRKAFSFFYIQNSHYHNIVFKCRWLDRKCKNTHYYKSLNPDTTTSSSARFDCKFN